MRKPVKLASFNSFIRFKEIFNILIETEVLTLGHKEAEKQKFQTQLAQVTVERDTFKNTIAFITATINLVQTTPAHIVIIVFEEI